MVSLFQKMGNLVDAHLMDGLNLVSSDKNILYHLLPQDKVLTIKLSKLVAYTGGESHCYSGGLLDSSLSQLDYLSIVTATRLCWELGKLFKVENSSCQCG